MMLTMVVDIDHVVADPIYDPNRCSIGFHPFHKLYFILLYGVLLFFKRVRWIGVGLMVHMLLDSIDCYQNMGIWWHSAV